MKKLTIKGVGGSPGVVTGLVKIILDYNKAAKQLKKGEILVTSLTDPNWTVHMERAKAIITNTGGVLSHAAIVSRELGIPCVVGTKNATEMLENGMKVEVDGTLGIVRRIQ